MFPLPSVSLSLCLCFGGVTCCRRERRRDGQSQRSAVKSRLWLMNRAALPSYWAEFTSSHNHSLFPQLLSPSGVYVFISFCLRPFVPVFSSSLSFVISLSASLVQIFLSAPALLYFAVVFVLTSHLLFIPHAVNLSTFAASGTRRTTRSPGTSSTQPTSISLWPSTPTTRA